MNTLTNINLVCWCEITYIETLDAVNANDTHYLAGEKKGEAAALVSEKKDEDGNAGK